MENRGCNDCSVDVASCEKGKFRHYDPIAVLEMTAMRLTPYHEQLHIPLQMSKPCWLIPGDKVNCLGKALEYRSSRDVGPRIDYGHEHVMYPVHLNTGFTMDPCENGHHAVEDL